MSVNTELLKNKDFRNTLFAIGANQLSDSMSYITTPIIILALTGSPRSCEYHPLRCGCSRHLRRSGIWNVG